MHYLGDENAYQEPKVLADVGMSTNGSQQPWAARVNRPEVKLQTLALARASSTSFLASFSIACRHQKHNLSFKKNTTEV